jgi:UPF0176 protein
VFIFLGQRGAKATRQPDTGNGSVNSHQWKRTACATCYHPDLLRERLEQEELPRTTLSFYRYVRLKETEDLRHALYTEWEQLGVLGRIYISQEGVNAQISLPTSNLDAFRSALDAQEAFRAMPWKIAVEDDGKSFLKLIIKVRNKIVADGLADDAFDVTNVGEHLDAKPSTEGLRKARW